MDNFKRKTIKNYTAWDINCLYIGSRKWKRMKIDFVIGANLRSTVRKVLIMK